MKLSSKNGFTLPLVFTIFSLYLLFTSFYLVIYSLKLKSLDALDDYYETAIVKMMASRRDDIE